jgi:large subunit ribosomal protein L25
MRKEITITAEARETRGKNEARRLRVRGLVPAIVYGTAKEPVSIAVSPKEVTSILKSASGHNTIFDIDIQGAKSPVMIVDWQFEPLKSTLLHVDLKRIDLSKKVIVKVPVHTHGDPVGVKVQGGQHEIITRDIEIECLPDDIPESFNVTVSELHIGQSVRASEIPLSGSMRLVSPADAVISHVIGIKATEPEPTEVAATPEPEVVKKGKKEEAAATPEKKDEKKKK